MSKEAKDRRQKLETLRQRELEKQGRNAEVYPNDFRRSSLAGTLQTECRDLTREELEQQVRTVKVAGRIMAHRQMGKTNFMKLTDSSGEIQLMVVKAEVPTELWKDLNLIAEVGDIVGAEGTLTKTKSGELSIRVSALRHLAKALEPFPEKFHSLTDVEARYRKRYLDLITNAESRKVFQQRSQLITCLRDYLNQRDFLEVETPMMQSLPGGATAQPFVTHHNALDMELYLRVAPELYLKRLIVGGFEKVYELNRSFRNEGISTRHNPEFTMLEFYQAYADYHDAMNLTEDLIRSACLQVLDKTLVTWGNQTSDLSKPFARISFYDALQQINDLDFNQPETLRNRAIAEGIAADDTVSDDQLCLKLFEKLIEPKLMAPTFVMDYPAVISPLARRSSQNPDIAERFELFIFGCEIANGFSELNDPNDQDNRLQEQARQKSEGDDEAMYYDADYIEALAYAMPPTAGVGIGIDRLTMILTGSLSIRDVILFPLMHRK